MDKSWEQEAVGVCDSPAAFSTPGLGLPGLVLGCRPVLLGLLPVSRDKDIGDLCPVIGQVITQAPPTH